MLNQIKSYLFALMNPAKYHSFLETDEITENIDFELVRLKLSESILLSWIFSICKGIMDLAIIFIGVFFINKLTSTESGTAVLMIQKLIKSGNVTSNYLYVISIALDILFFPITIYFFVTVWKTIWKYFVGFLKLERDVEQDIEDILIVSLSSNIFKVVPVIGNFIQQIVSVYLLYVGFRERLKTTKLFTIFLIILPPLVLLVFIGSIILFFIILFKFLF